MVSDNQNISPELLFHVGGGDFTGISWPPQRDVRGIHEIGLTTPIAVTRCIFCAAVFERPVRNEFEVALRRACFDFGLAAARCLWDEFDRATTDRPVRII